MSIINIKHYTKDTLSQEVAQQLHQLSPDTLTPYFQRYSSEPERVAHCFTVSIDTKLLGFALLSTLDNVATLHSVFIKKEYRRKSLGKKLSLHILSTSVRLKCHKVTLESEKSQLSFFKSLGFVVIKEPCFKTQTTLFKLENPCPAYFLSAYKQTQIENQQKKSKTSQPLMLSQDKTIYNFHDEAQFLSLHRNMLSQANRRIWIMANAINAPLLRDEHFSQSILKLAKNNPQAQIRILLEEDKTGSGRFNPLINLAQRLTSFVEIRTLPSTAGKFQEWVTLVDFSAGIYRKTMATYTGFACYDNHLIARRLITKYEDHWQFAKESIEFRRLAI